MESRENGSIDNHINVGAGSSSVPLNSRWNPTKEQISMLENLYKQGIRTPTADQIQQITSRLRAFGHIEGKNVFYWFQNHKARQRQKQKQECLAYIHRLYHNKDSHHQPAIFAPSPRPNMACTPCYFRQREKGLYAEYPNAILPMAGFKRRPMNQKICTTINFSDLPQENNSVDQSVINQQTLPLFPLHPTGNLQGRETPKFSLDSSTPNDTSDTTLRLLPTIMN